MRLLRGIYGNLIDQSHRIAENQWFEQRAQIRAPENVCKSDPGLCLDPCLSQAMFVQTSQHIVLKQFPPPQSIPKSYFIIYNTGNLTNIIPNLQLSRSLIPMRSHSVNKIQGTYYSGAQMANLRKFEEFTCESIYLSHLVRG